MSILESETPLRPVEKWARPLVRFLHIEAASGGVLIVATLAALAIANSPLSEAFDAFWETHVSFGVGRWKLDESLRHWINDGLMAIFFFVVGLEIKRELVAGELRDPRQAALPVAAALGGMIAPAAIYLALRGGRAGHEGWGIPMATDIAFVVGFLALLGKRAPIGLKIMLLSLAIVDDIGAVLVIAIFYSGAISATALGVAAIALAAIVGLNAIGVRSVWIYWLFGAGLWLAMLESGIHPTIAGVLLGLVTPARALVGDQALFRLTSEVAQRLRDDDDGKVSHRDRPRVGELVFAARESQSPLERLEAALHPWVGFAIMPLFALANAGVKVEVSALGDPIAVAVAISLFVGKPLGIVLFSWLAIVARLARLPAGVDWRAMAGAGCLGGIGFTMSLFVAGLALEGASLDAAKIGVLAGSCASAVVGYFILFSVLPKRGETHNVEG